MLTGRPLQKACLSCRMRVLTASARIATDLTGNSALRIPATPSRRLQYLGSPLQHRCFSRSNTRLNEITEPHRPSDPSLDAPPPLPQRSPRELEALVRQARQAFGDTLPKDYLTDAEYKVYTRLYGEPQVVEDEPEEEEVQVEEPGTQSLYKEAKDRRMEEVEYRYEEERIEDLRRIVAERNTDPRLKADMENAIESDYSDEEASSVDQEDFEYSDPESDVDPSEYGDPDYQRIHPLTIRGKFTTSPATILLPRDSLIEPINDMISEVSNKHLTDVARKTFGGRILPFSTLTAPKSLGIPQRPIPLDAHQGQMAPREADAYMTAVVPGTYASVMSALVEIRKRLGASWLEGLLKKESGPLILDAGAGGAGVLAWRDVLKAEWQRIEEDAGNLVSTTSAPLGRATVVTGSDTLRHRASRLLQETTFIPRLPEKVMPSEHVGPEPRKIYDIIVAPHTLWPLKEDYMRKDHVQKLWSLLNPDGGVLLLLEKGLPRGFEIVAGARELLLEKHIASPGHDRFEIPLQQQATGERYMAKEPGMIIAPCTNHAKCPMYLSHGESTGRKDFCYFRQRYIRPPFLQRLLDAKDRNHEDVQFSYVAVMRGRDQRLEDHALEETGPLVQGDEATDAAFMGYDTPSPSSRRNMSPLEVPGSSEPSPPPYPELPPPSQPDLTALPSMDSSTPTEEPRPSSSSKALNFLSLPRMILPPMKRKGHIILEVCTPSAKLERWTVPRSFSKQAFRDARKAQWGDLWALGAKTRQSRFVRLGRQAKFEETEDGKKGSKGAKRKEKAERKRKEKAGRKGLRRKNLIADVE